MARTFTSRAVIAELALLLNRLPGMLPTAFFCPNVAVGSSRPPSPYPVVFTPWSRRWPMVAAAPVGCFDGGIVVGKHRQPALDFSRDKIIPAMLPDGPAGRVRTAQPHPGTARHGKIVVQLLQATGHPTQSHGGAPAHHGFLTRP